MSSLPPWKPGSGSSFVDASDWVGTSETSADRGPQLNRALAAVAGEGGATLVLPPFPLTVSEPALPDDLTTVIGTPGASQIVVGAGSDCAAMKSARYGAGGTERVSLRDFVLDGNFAQNPGTTEPLLALDGIAPNVSGLVLRNGYLLLSSEQSRAEPGYPVSVEGHFDNLRLENGVAGQIEYSGPTDSRFDRIESWTNSGQSFRIKKVSYWRGCHPYGNAENHWVLEAGQIECIGCQGEGASKAQVLILSPSTIWRGGRIFSPSGEKLGIQLGSSALGKLANGTVIGGVVITGCTGGSLKYDNSASNSLVKAWIEQASGTAVVGEHVGGQVYPVVSGGAAVGPQTENHGQVTIAAGATAVVEHGLLGAPSQYQLAAQRESTGLTTVGVYVIKRTATQLEIRNNSSAEVNVNWWAKV